MLEIYIPLTVIVVLYFLIGIIGNSLVLVIYSKPFEGRNDCRFFIPVLAIIDMISCTVNCSFHISENIVPVMFESDIRCKISWFSGMIAAEASIFTLVIIAVDRYMKICKPFKRQLSVTKKKLSIPIFAIISVILSAPCLLFYGLAQVKSVDNINGTVCSSVTGNMPTLSMAFSISILVLTSVQSTIMSVFYFLICKVIFRQQKRRKQMKTAAVMQIVEEHKDIKMADKKATDTICSAKSKYPSIEKYRIDRRDELGEDEFESGIVLSSNDSTEDPHENNIRIAPNEYEDELNEGDSCASVNGTYKDHVNTETKEHHRYQIASTTDTCHSGADYSTDRFNTEKLSVKHCHHPDIRSELPKSSTEEVHKYGATIVSKPMATIENMEIANDIQTKISPKHLCANKKKMHPYKISIMFLVITIVFSISYLPKVVLMFMDSTTSDVLATHPNTQLFVRFLHSIYLVNSLVNPFIYGIMDPQFKASLKNLCQRRHVPVH